MQTINDYHTLILSGGGLRGVAILGGLHYLRHHTFNTYIGTSAGALIAFLTIIGYTPIELYTIVFHQLHNILNIQLDNIFEKWGLSDHTNIQNILTTLLFNKLNVNNITFKQLFNLTNKHLIITTTNLTHNKTMYLDYINTPEVDVIQGVLASISIPLIFTPVYINDCMCVDGGIYEHVPIKNVESQGVFVIHVVSMVPVMPTSFIQYVFSIVVNILYTLNFKDIDLGKYVICNIPFHKEMFNEVCNDLINNPYNIKYNFRHYFKKGYIAIKNTIEKNINVNK